MTEPYTRLHNLAVRHRISLGRYSTTVVRRVLALLNRTDQDIVARLARADNEGRDAALLELLLNEIRATQADGWTLVRARLGEDLQDLSGAEAAFQKRLLSIGAGSVQVELQTQSVTASQVYAAASARPFQGRLLREWLSEAEEGAAKRVRDAIRIGFVEGQTVSQIVQRVRGTKALRYTDGALQISRRGAETMVRTAITHVASVASQETYKAAGDLVVGVEWVSTLDSRTSDICRGRDGKVYPVESGPRPPAHLNCRSTTIARLKGMPTFPRKLYAEWLGDQPASVQDDILGPSRGRLFRTGALKIGGFTDNKGRTLTLQQLRERDASAFEAAGL